MAGFVTISPLTIGADGSATQQNTVQAAVNDLAGKTQTAINGVTGGRGVSQVLAQSAVPASVTGTTSETVLATIPIPAGAMGSNGALRITAYWSYPNNANTKNLKVTLGGVSVVGVGRTTFASDYWLLSLINRGLQNSQVRPVSPFPYGSSANGMSPMAVDTSVAQNLIFSAQPANAADTITLEAYTVELLNP